MSLLKEFVKKESALVFNGLTGELLMVRVSPNKKKRRFDFPSWIIEEENTFCGKEIWRSYTIAWAVSMTEVASGHAVQKMIQPMPACYHADGEDPSVDCEGIIVGEIYFLPDNDRIFSVGPLDLIRLAEKGNVLRSTKLLGLRAFASRDCPVDTFQEIAGRELERMH